MKKKLFQLLCIALMFNNAYGQTNDIIVTWGPDQKCSSVQNDREQSYNIGKDLSGGFYSLRERYKYIYGQVSGVKRFIEHFDSNGNLIGSKKLVIEQENSKRFFNGVIYSNGKMYLVTNYFSGDIKKNILEVQSINQNTLLVEGERRSIAEIPYKIEPLYWYNQYTLKIMDDKIYAMHIGPEGENKQTILGIYVYDKDFNLQWNLYQRLNYQEKLFQLEDYDVDSKGTVRVMAIVYKDKKRKIREGKPNYEYHFFVFYDEGKNFMEHTVSLSDKYITDMRFSYRPDGDIACAGFYSNESSWRWTNSIAGTFYVTLDPETSHIKIENYMDFSPEFLTGFKDADKAEQGKELKNIVLNDLHFLDDGGAVLLAEETTESQINMSMTMSFFSTNHTQYNDYYITTSTTVNCNWTNYQFDNIIIVQVNPEGVIDWARIIPKKQHTSSDAGMFSSYAIAYAGDKIDLVYNDNPKNLTSSADKVYGFGKNKDAVVVCAEIDSDGNISKNALFSAGEAEVLTCPRSCRQSGTNSMSLYGKKGNTFRWGTLEFQ